MKILFLAHTPLSTPGGQSIYNRQILEALPKGADVMSLSFGIGRPPTGWRKRLGQAMTLWSRYPSVALSTRERRDIVKHVESILCGFEPDVVIVSQVQLAWLVPRLRILAPVTKIAYILHNPERIAHASIARLLPFPLNWAALLDAWKIGRMETRAIENADFFSCISLEDYQVLGRRATPHVILPPYVRDAPLSRESSRVLLVGSFGWLPKRKNAEWLANQIWPLIEGRDLELVIVGNHADRVAIPIDSGVVAVANPSPDELSKFLQDGGIMVVPERQVGGVKIKCLEAASHGFAIISTAAGLSGTGLRAGLEAIRAESERDFQHGIQWLISNRAERKRLGRAARDLIRTTRSPSKILDANRAAIAQMLTDET